MNAFERATQITNPEPSGCTLEQLLAKMNAPKVKAEAKPEVADRGAKIEVKDSRAYAWPLGDDLWTWLENNAPGWMLGPTSNTFNYAGEIYLHSYEYNGWEHGENGPLIEQSGSRAYWQANWPANGGGVYRDYGASDEYLIVGRVGDKVQSFTATPYSLADFSGGTTAEREAIKNYCERDAWFNLNENPFNYLGTSLHQG